MTWSPSHGQPLTPAGYHDLFETIPVRLYGEAGPFADVVRGGPLDLSRVDSQATLDGDPALTIVASPHPGVYEQHPLDQPTGLAGELRINPLYQVETRGSHLHLRLTFPNAECEDEYRACRQYLPDEAIVDRAALDALQSGAGPVPLADLVRRRVIVELPARYY